MNKERYTSIYLPVAVKTKVVAAARRSGYVVTRGPKSDLARFIQAMLDEHQKNTSSAIPVFIDALTPELLVVLQRLSRFGPTEQRWIGKMLEVWLQHPDLMFLSTQTEEV
jgi:hypothetical protein